MNVLDAAALWFPAVRRLRDSHAELLADRQKNHDRMNILESRLTDLQSRLPPSREDAEAAEARIARSEGRLIITEYPYQPRRRAIEDAPGGKRLKARFLEDEHHYATTLRGAARHLDALLRIPRSQAHPTAPFWANGWFPPFDCASLYGLIAERAPRRYIEVGSGMSTRFARQAISELGLQTRIVSIDPHPHTVVDVLCDEVMRSRMEDVPHEFWDGIGPEDLLFVDNSHRSFPNSDVTVFFAEVLPALKHGTVWGLHDICLPWDYPEEWRGRFYSEQYLLLAYLLGGAAGDDIVLPVTWASWRPALHDILAPLWAREDLFHDIGTRGSSFWMRRGTSASV